jgi:phosphatidylserine/phosphatidylglycerophosphate/cardiolipin synthase-like enzyme
MNKMRKIIPALLLGTLVLQGTGQVISIEEARQKGAGAAVTVTGVILNGPELGRIRYIQDETAAIAVYPGSGSVTLNALRGDRITVSGTNKFFAELLEIDALTSVEIVSSGNKLPDPVVITPDKMGPDFEGQLIQFRNIIFVNASGTFAGDKNYNVSFEGKTGEVRIYRDSPIVGKVIPTGSVNLTGICSRYYSTFQMLPRDNDDIEQTSSIYFTKVPEISNLTQNGFDLNWETNIKGSSEILYDSTPDFKTFQKIHSGDSTTSHSISIKDGSPSQLYYVKIRSISGNDTARLPNPKVYITRSASSGDIKAYFNREVDNSVSVGVNALRVYRALDDTLINYINRTKESIDFTIYNYNLVEVSDITAALNAAHSRGVRVRVIHDGNANNSGFASLDPAIGKIISPESNYVQNVGIMHNKFVVFDAEHSDPDVPVVWTGSTNFTDSQVNTDPNSVVIVQDKSLAKAYTLEFNEMYGSDGAQPDEKKALFGASKKDNTPHEFIVGDRRIECYFSPSDNVHAKIKETLNFARKDISIATMLITKSDIGYILRDQHKAGVAVRVLVNSKANCSPTVVQTLTGSLPDNMFLETSESGIMHHKYMLIDRTSQEPLLWVGCHNWSTAADVRNDENTLVIHDATLVNIYYQEFYKRFSASGGAVGLQVWEIDGKTWKVYPNPVRDELRILYDGSSPVRTWIDLYDVNGQLLMTAERVISPGPTFLRIPQNINSGIYILMIRTRDRAESFRLSVE